MRLNKNIYIRLIIFFTAEDGEGLYSQEKKKKKDLELTVAQIISSDYCKIQAQIEESR